MNNDELIKKVLSEINWDDIELSDVNARCMSLDAVKDWFNSEIARYDNKEKAAKNMPRVSKSIMIKVGEHELNIKQFVTLLTTPPKTNFDEGEKSKHSGTEDILTINTGIPALRGIVWDKDKGEFYIINTCPKAGACAIDCYALQGFYILCEGKNLKLAQRLQLMMEDPETYYTLAYREAEIYAFKANRDNKILEIRWNDAGDFFSERYFKLALKITKTLLSNKYKVKSYFYTKVGKYVELGEKLGFEVTFSSGGIDKTPTASKQSVIVPFSVFKHHLFSTRGRGYEKDETGKAKIRDNHKSLLKADIYNAYKEEFPNITLNNILFTDELPRQEGNERKYNVIILPVGDTDSPAQRKDVSVIFLLKH